jgi:hypothetical protein
VSGIPKIAAAGRVEGGSDVLPLGTSATGTIAELLVHAGAHVQAGQHLVRVECSAIKRELDARKSDLAAAEAFYLRTLHGPRVEEISVGVANVNLAEHVSTGVASREYLNMMLAEPFAPFIFSPAGAAVYQLGAFGTAAKRLREWALKQ